MFVLRDYQEEALRELAAAWVDLHARGEPERILLVSRTGTGKTVISGSFMERVRRKGKRCNFVVRDRTLIDQTSRHLSKIGIRHGVVAAGDPRVDPSAGVQVCSAQTLTVRGEAPDADVLVFDEAHTIACDTSTAIVMAHPHATILGLTATPERSDGRPLGGKDGIFRRLVQVRRTFEQLVADGALVDFVLDGPDKPTKELSRDPVSVLAQHGRARWPDGRPRVRKTVFFCRDRAHARDVAERSRAAGFRAAHVDGVTKTSDRDLVRLGLPEGDRDALDVIASVDMIKQGFDCPPVELLILACGFGSWTPYMQALGRGLRPVPPEQRHLFGKTLCHIHDLRGSFWIHGPPSEDRQFSLEGASKRPSNVIALLSCRACGATYRPRPKCPRCGAVRPPEAPPVIVERATRTVRPAEIASQATKRAAYDDLVAKAKARGYKPAWVGVMFKERFGHWPRWAGKKAA